MTTKAKPKLVENTIPVLGVSDMEQSIRFYTQTLEFELDWGGGDHDSIGSISKDGHSIMLLEQEAGKTGTGTWVWIGMEDDSLFELYKSRGVKIVQEPINRAWAYEMKIADPDGNVLWLGTGPKKDIPLVD
jgi:predicted lactoylglutathione lyase